MVPVLVASAAAVVLAMALTAYAARRTGRWSVVDVTWGSGFVGIAVLATALGDGDLLRRLMLVAMVAVWGSRLAWHIVTRARGHGEDPRYQALRDSGAGLLGRVLLPQGIAMFLVSLPVQVGSVSDRSVGWLGWVGVAVWMLGLVFEATGDAQLTRFKADPANRGRIMDRGLWAWTRHPNYFGDACVWVGIWLVAADSGWAGVATIVSPIAMTWFIVAVTGAKLLERSMMRRPGYPEYAARTSMFLPLPPRRP